MHLRVETGQAEKHTVEFSFDQIFGIIRIMVDGRLVRREVQVLSFSPIKQYELEVGESEVSKVLLIKERPLLFSGFRPQRYRVYVNGVLVKSAKGY